MRKTPKNLPMVLKEKDNARQNMASERGLYYCVEYNRAVITHQKFRECWWDCEKRRFESVYARANLVGAYSRTRTVSQP